MGKLSSWEEITHLKEIYTKYLTVVFNLLQIGVRCSCQRHPCRGLSQYCKHKDIQGYREHLHCISYYYDW